MQIAPIVTQLKTITEFANRVFPARDVATAVEYARTQAGGSPSCVVYAPQESAGPNGMRVGRSVVQEIAVRFGVMVCQTYAGDSEKALEAVDAINAEVIETLLGWIPATDYNPCELNSGRLVYSDIGLVIWSTEFRTKYTVRAIP